MHLQICIWGIHLSWHNPSGTEHNYSYKHGSYHIQFQLHEGNSSFYCRCVAAQTHLGKILRKAANIASNDLLVIRSDVFTWRKVTIAENTDSLFPGVTATLHYSNMRAHHFSSAGESSRNARAFRSIVSMLVKLTGSATTTSSSSSTWASGRSRWWSAAST